MSTLPGFTGETSLYTSTHSYVVTKGSRSERGSGTVVPAFRCGFTCFACALAIADGIPFDEYLPCGACLACVGGSA